MTATYRASAVTIAAVAGLCWFWPAAPAVPLALSLPAEDNDDYEWIHPQPDPKQPNNCGNCHAEIYEEWSRSKHSLSAINSRVLDEIAAVAHERPDDIGVCAKCHAPTMHDSNLDYDLRKVTGVDAHGVHCDYCHKVAEAPPGKLGTRFGSDGLWLARPFNKQQVFFGPLDDAVREGEQLVYKPIYKESRYCASCHEGVIFGKHVYGTYSEWLASPACRDGKQCQTCHMAPTGKMTNIAPGKGGLERAPRTLASHVMPGGTKEILRRCLSLKTSVGQPRHVGSRGVQQEVTVEVTADNVGHRVPTGSPSRQLLVLVDLLDVQGRQLRIDGNGPRAVFQGQERNGKLYAKRFLAETGLPVSFWEPHVRVEDTRLFPGRRDRLDFTALGEVETVKVRLYYSALENSYVEPAVFRGALPEYVILVLEDTLTLP